LSNAGEWAARLKAFHEKQLDRPRKLYRIGRTKMVVTGGRAASTAGAAVAFVAVDSPGWLLLAAVAGGFFGGKYLYPVPRNSAAVRSGSSAVGGHPAVGANAGQAHLSLPDTPEFAATAARHDLLKRRWLSYEVDPQKQLDYPAMCDASLPATSAMIKAMRVADQARTAGNPAEYKLAVDRFSQALLAAEQAAGVP
jgi:hypothetical protein